MRGIRPAALVAALAAGTGYTVYGPPSKKKAPAAASAAAGAAAPPGVAPPPPAAAGAAQDVEHVVNWSNTHSVTLPAASYAQPASLGDLATAVADASSRGAPLRPVGSALSPNALGLSERGMINVGLMDAVLAVDAAAHTATVQAGARVADIVPALRAHGLTLPTYASISEQQLGGLTQVGAHGSGATQPPSDEAVVGMTLVTPAAGVVRLSADDADGGARLRMARVGLGALGVVADLTLRVVDDHRLVEQSWVEGRDAVAAAHAGRLARHKYLRYMWIPHTDAVVVVTADVVPPGVSDDDAVAGAGGPPAGTDEERLAPARALLTDALGRRGRTEPTAADVRGLGWTELRDELLALDPLEPTWVARVNAAEAAYWRAASGARVGPIHTILGFDCGGEQWVSEVALPVPPAAPTADVDFVRDILGQIEAEAIPAHAPIEQRWSAGSASPLSPVAGPPDSVHTWVGIIMYLPARLAGGGGDGGSGGGGGSDGGGTTRAAVTAAFAAYKRALAERQWEKYGAVEHWAKIEPPADADEAAALTARVARRYPVAAFTALRDEYDPQRLLSNELLDAIFGEGGGRPPAPSTEKEKRKVGA
ncbi:hypothetical protein BU14_0077s0055 [Porphyra umbilicalis]|uniref:FAD-binding PCMH-type domain-containing protein n=1 Tax=Porphyra umbilicalis TaxID=2786 RepID=A0A1X6PFB4_PORUM|nr:hypothetical protein BU14_0077s0055 [Porphyra umbilicalis]|eukprot:OSX79435.1 hypothetical protein BU14_0077s0055 [Porphyra umbilicalis]